MSRYRLTMGPRHGRGRRRMQSEVRVTAELSVDGVRMALQDEARRCTALNPPTDGCGWRVLRADVQLPDGTWQERRFPLSADYVSTVLGDDGVPSTVRQPLTWPR